MTHEVDAALEGGRKDVAAAHGEYFFILGRDEVDLGTKDAEHEDQAEEVTTPREFLLEFFGQFGGGTELLSRKIRLSSAHWMRQSLCKP